MLFRGIGHSVNPTNAMVRSFFFPFSFLFFFSNLYIPQVVKVLSASPSAYSANPKTKLSKAPSLTGSAISFVSVVQVIPFTNCI